MKNFVRLGCLLAIAAILIIGMAMQKKVKRAISFGDSITQAGVRGNGYMNLLKRSLDSTKYELIGAGIGGNKVYELYLRTEDILLIL